MKQTSSLNVLDRMRERLLDLTNGNRLLSYRHPRTKSLRSCERNGTDADRQIWNDEIGLAHRTNRFADERESKRWHPERRLGHPRTVKASLVVSDIPESPRPGGHLLFLFAINPVLSVSRIRGILWLPIVLIASACTDNPAGSKPLPDVPVSVTATATPPESTTVSPAAFTTLSVRVLGRKQEPVPGAAVTWRVTLGASTLSDVQTSTDASGIATASWIPGTSAGETEVSVQVAALKPVKFHTTTLPDSAVEMHAGVDSLHVQLDDTLSLTTSATDRYTNEISAPATEWTSLDPTVASVTRAGFVTAKHAGSTRLVGRLGALADTVSIRVASPDFLVRSIAAVNQYTCAVGTDSTLYCWGSNPENRFHTTLSLPYCGTTPCAATPIPVAMPTAPTLVKSWGSSSGEKPLLVLDSQSTWRGITGDVLIQPLVDPDATLSTGQDERCWIDTTGRTRCSGYNHFGEDGMGGWHAFLGDPLTPALDTVQPRLDAYTFHSVVVGAYHACALTGDGTAYCWGKNDAGQLGAASTEFCDGAACSPYPIGVSGGHKFKTLASGMRFTCGLTLEGSTYCWGANYTGQLGVTPSKGGATPVQVQGNHVFKAIYATSYTPDDGTVCGLTPEGLTYCWGNGYFGVLGVTNDALSPCVESNGGSMYPCSPTPLAVPAPQPFVGLTVNTFRICGLTARGVPFCWGSMTGDGTTETRLQPTRVHAPVR